jgi:hypothetical protein
MYTSWSFTLLEEYKFSVYKHNSEGVCGPTKQNVTGGWKKLSI